jgi:hypothetical protein
MVLWMMSQKVETVSDGAGIATGLDGPGIES